MYIPIKTLGNENAGIWIKAMSVVAGKLAASFGCKEYPPYSYNESLTVTYKDYHFYRNSPLIIWDFCYFRYFVVLTIR